MPADRQGPALAAADTTRPAREDIAVALAGLSKRFGGVVALDDVSLQVHRGELLTLLGPSGCGKTTLLHLVAGFLTPDRGEISIDGAHVADVPTWRREVGIMFQSYALFPHMTVARNVGYGLRMRRVARPEIARRVAQMLALIKLEGLDERKPRQLSGGQQQRVALARALVIQPRVLLLDEPFSALDRNLRASMQVELKEIIRKLGVTTIFVTHDQSEALSLSDRIAVIAHGRIRQLGSAEDIYRRPADRFVASFVGDVNVLRARLDKISATTATVALGPAHIEVPSRALAGTSSGTMVDLFLRPEELRLAEPGTTAVTHGVVAAQIYQGSHVDLHLDVPEALSGRILLRVPGQNPVVSSGARVGIALATDKAIAFRPATDP